MSTGNERAIARDLQRRARTHPCDRAHDPNDLKYFRQVDRAVIWGLTLNK